MKTEERLKKISSLSDLHKEKEKLRLSMKVNRENLEHSIGLARTTLPKFMAKKVVLPAGAVGLTAFGITKMVKSNKSHKAKVKAAEEEKNSSGGLLSKIAPLALHLLTRKGMSFIKKQLRKNSGVTPPSVRRRSRKKSYH